MEKVLDKLYGDLLQHVHPEVNTNTINIATLSANPAQSSLVSELKTAINNDFVSETYIEISGDLSQILYKDISDNIIYQVDYINRTDGQPSGYVISRLSDSSTLTASLSYVDGNVVKKRYL